MHKNLCLKGIPKFIWNSSTVQLVDIAKSMSSSFFEKESLLSGEITEQRNKDRYLLASVANKKLGEGNTTKEKMS